MLSLLGFWNSLSGMNTIQRWITVAIFALGTIAFFVDRRVNALQKDADDEQERLAMAADTQRDKEIADTKLVTAEANKVAAAANERAAGLEKEAATANLELAKLQRFVTEPRTITFEVMTTTVSKILMDAPKGSIEIEWDGNSHEAEHLAFHLNAILGMCDWKVLKWEGQRRFPLRPGIRIMYWGTKEVPLPEPVAALRKAFEAAAPEIGPVSWDDNVGNPSHPLLMTIGPKL
jgi:hypothetical protein